jgi:hypothetical protein
MTRLAYPSVFRVENRNLIPSLYGSFSVPLAGHLWGRSLLCVDLPSTREAARVTSGDDVGLNFLQWFPWC